MKEITNALSARIAIAELISLGFHIKFDNRLLSDEEWVRLANRCFEFLRKNKMGIPEEDLMIVEENTRRIH